MISGDPYKEVITNDYKGNITRMFFRNLSNHYFTQRMDFDRINSVQFYRESDLFNKYTLQNFQMKCLLEEVCPKHLLWLKTFIDKAPNDALFQTDRKKYLEMAFKLTMHEIYLAINYHISHVRWGPQYVDITDGVYDKIYKHLFAIGRNTASLVSGGKSKKPNFKAAVKANEVGIIAGKTDAFNEYQSRMHLRHLKSKTYVRPSEWVSQTHLDSVYEKTYQEVYAETYNSMVESKIVRDAVKEGGKGFIEDILCDDASTDFLNLWAEYPRYGGDLATIVDISTDMIPPAAKVKSILLIGYNVWGLFIESIRAKEKMKANALININIREKNNSIKDRLLIDLYSHDHSYYIPNLLNWFAPDIVHEYSELRRKVFPHKTLFPNGKYIFSKDFFVDYYLEYFANEDKRDKPLTNQDIINFLNLWYIDLTDRVRQDAADDLSTRFPEFTPAQLEHFRREDLKEEHHQALLADFVPYPK